MEVPSSFPAVMTGLQELVHFWFKEDYPRMWFNATADDDEYIKQRFHRLFLKTPFINISKDIKNPEIVLAKILVFDQLPRHFFRSQGCDSSDRSSSIYISQMCERLCETIQQIFCIDPYYLNNYSSIYKKNFFILPLRHSYKYQNVKKCYDILLTNNELLVNKNFYYHTLKKLTTFKKPVRCFPKTGFFYDYMIYNFVVDTNLYKNYSFFDRCFNTCFNTVRKMFFSYFSFSYKFDEKTLVNTNVYRIVRNAVYNLSREVDKLNLIVSFSGGVDSSLLLACLITLEKMSPIKIIDSLQAIHINYNNRGFYSSLEREFCIRFCTANNVPIFVRDITETHRATEFDRGIYEDVTKEIRFDSYKFLMNQRLERSDTLIDNAVRGNEPRNEPYFVCLGHNKDDCYENLISNIKISKNFNNLFGMEELSTNKGVNIFRPLLTVSKEEILYTALRCGVFHTQNSTPKECERGKIRETFKNQKDFLQGLEKVKELVSQSYAVVEYIYEENIAPFIIIGDNTLTMPLYSKELFLNQIYVHFFKKQAQANLFIKPSKYSVENLVKEIGNKKSKRVNLTKSMYCELDFEEEKITFFFRA